MAIRFSFTPHTKHTVAPKEKRIPTTSDVGHWSRNDNAFLTLLGLFSNGTLYQLATPQSLRDSSPKRGAKRVRCNHRASP